MNIGTNTRHDIRFGKLILDEASIGSNVGAAKLQEIKDNTGVYQEMLDRFDAKGWDIHVHGANQMLTLEVRDRERRVFALKAIPGNSSVTSVYANIALVVFDAVCNKVDQTMRGIQHEIAKL